MKYLYQPQKSECCLYQLMFLRLRISFLFSAAAAAFSWMLPPAEGDKRGGAADPEVKKLKLIRGNSPKKDAKYTKHYSVATK